jgi:hypothetical protein
MDGLMDGWIWVAVSGSTSPTVLQQCWLIVLARLWKYLLAPPGAPTPTTTRQTPSRERGDYGRAMAGNFAGKWRVPRHLKGCFTCRKSTTWDRRLYFPSEGRHAENFFAPKNPTASAGFEPANLGTRDQHPTPRPSKPLISRVHWHCSSQTLMGNANRMLWLIYGRITE